MGHSAESDAPCSLACMVTGGVHHTADSLREAALAEIAEHVTPPAESESPQPENVVPINRPKRTPPPGRSLKSMSTRTPAPTSSATTTAPVGTEPVDFGAARVANADADMERAIRVLRDARLIHPDDPHNSATQRAAAWRAKQWRTRNAK